MSEQIHFDARERVQRRLHKPLFLTAHALLFGVVVAIASMVNFLGYGVIHATTSWAAAMWCGLLVIHAVVAFNLSGVSKNRRDKVIQEELLRYDDELSTDELVETHERLSDEIRRQVTPMYWTLAAVVGFSGLWHAMPVIGLFVANWFGGYIEERYYSVLTQFMPLVGTMFLTVGLAGVQFLLRQKEDREMRNAYLRALYTTKAEKRKRLASERLTIDDEGEIVLEKIDKRSMREV